MAFVRRISARDAESPMSRSLRGSSSVQATYCELWSDPLHEPVDPMSSDFAQLLDRRGEPYAVALSILACPDVMIEVNWKNSHLGVWFSDEEGRRDLHYAFTRVDDARLFLAEITLWTYPADAVFLFEASVVETVSFREDGYVKQTIDDGTADSINVFEYSGVPVETNWEPVPAFGDWTSVARRDRKVSSGS